MQGSGMLIEDRYIPGAVGSRGTVLACEFNRFHGRCHVRCEIDAMHVSPISDSSLYLKCRTNHCQLHALFLA